ncbi:MAG: nucleotide sugar dehydrogenase [Solirubrobacteraceae bacterium]
MSQLRVAVAGLWHLGVVTAACLADAGFDVLAVDPDPEVIAQLREGVPPVAEPGLAELVASGLSSRRLAFDASAVADLSHADVVWITFDTPVRDDDSADPEWVLDQAARLLSDARSGATVIVSSQLPAGSVAALARRLADENRSDLHFACIPENLRLGDALAAFTHAERFVVGVSPDGDDRAVLEELLAPLGAQIEWMRIESAEMTKHALNAFLATEVAFINEIATICEQVGADASEVSRGLLSERRVGTRAYLRPGDAFAGGTLARDIAFLGRLADRSGFEPLLVDGVQRSNAEHRNWSRHALERLLTPLRGRLVAVWGLTYKPGTDTLRRSLSLELCHWLATEGVTVRAHDPAITRLPPKDAAVIELAPDPLAALRDADALAVCTPWPEYRAIAAGDVVSAMAQPIVIDPPGHLLATLGIDNDVRYARVGVMPR